MTLTDHVHLAICPVQFLYDAAMKTPVVVSPSGARVTYSPAARGNLSGTCWLCGCETSAGFTQRKVIKPTFTDAGLAKASWSNVVCEHCTWALSYMSLRNYSLLVTRDGLQHPSRPEIRKTLLQPPTKPFMLCVAESGQIWLHYKGKVASGRDPIPIRFEHLDIFHRPAVFLPLLNAIERLYAVFSKAEIASACYSDYKIRKFGLSRFERFETELMPHRRSALFKLALFVAQREERSSESEVKEACTTVF